MRIKKHNNGNEFLLTKENMWVRNFTKSGVPYIDINKTYNKNDYFIFLKNEIQNSFERYAWIDTENFHHDKVVIISEGYNFSEKHLNLMKTLPKDVAIIGVNQSLKMWKSPERNMTYYLINNPYDECMKFMPRKNRGLPKCITSTRTNYEFLFNYKEKGSIYKYCPVSEEDYNGKIYEKTKYQIDDCRNPVCAAIQLCYQFGTEKILLFCCDDSFNQERPGSEKLHNGLWQYPQQNIAHGLIDATVYWLKSMKYSETYLKDHSSGPLYENAVYIDEDEIQSFFN